MIIRKIIEIRPEGMSLFMQYLKLLAEQKNWGWEFESHQDLSRDLFKDAMAVKVEPSLSAKILPRLKVLPTQVRTLEVLDCMFAENGTWYPRLLCYEALRLLLVEKAPDLDIRNPVFVVGHNEQSRVVVSVLADIGCSEFYLVGDTEFLNLEKEFLLRRQLGIHIHILPPDELTMQALSAGIVINTQDLSQEKALLLDLSYFNFMKQGGYVLDLNLSGHENLLLEEAEKAGLKVLSPVSVVQVFTRLWLELLNKTLSDEEIRESWFVFLKQISSSV